MKKPDYAKLLSDYPLSQKIFADTEGFEVEDAPLPETEGNPVPIIEPEMKEVPDADGEAVGIFDPERIKEDVRRNLALWQEEDIKVGDDQYRLLVDTMGEPGEAAAELNLGSEMSADDPDYVEWVISQGNGLVGELAAAAELPGAFEFELDREALEEDPDAVPTIDLVLKFNKEDLDGLLGAGYSLMQEGAEEEPSFDEIMSSLVEAGHEDIARKIYNAIYPVRKH